MHESRWAFAGFAIMATSQLWAQRGGGDWMTLGYDAQRSSWVRSDAKISAETMAKPGFQRVWDVKTKSSLTPPALLDFYIGYRGFRSLGFVGGSSDTLIAIDTDLSRIEWEKSFASGSGAAATVACPGGMTSSVTRPTSSAYPPSGGGRGFGRGGAAKSGVGEPFEGAVTLKELAMRAAAPPPPPPSAPGRRTAPPPNPFARSPQYVNAITADGKFHSLYVSNGEEPNPPVDFLPPNAHARGLVVFDNTAYVATVNGCGGVASGVWALNLETKKVAQWKSNGELAGSTGFAAGPDGVLYVAAGGELVALEPVTLKVKASYKAGVDFASSPVVFDYKGKDLIAIATRDGRMQLLDSDSLSGPALSTTPAFSSAGFAAGSLASWQDGAGTRWVLAPASGAIAAFKVVDESGAPTLREGWVSRDLVSPLPPAIVNGVVFALERAGNAVLYALDGATGKELWNSGRTITSAVHTGGLAAGGSRVYVSGHDGTQYAFGFPMEH